MVTNANPKIANYHFTTLTPNLGVVQGKYGDDFVLADIYTNADIMKQAADAVKELEEEGFDFSNLKNSRLEKQIGLARNI